MDLRLFTDLNQLVKMRSLVKSISLSAKFKPSGILAGRNNSKLRGQGLDFEELRQYRQGDNLKDIDWKASSRSEKQMVRIFTEETDRSAIVVCDQRKTMMFGSKVYTKSVIAAETSALIAWLFLERGDRIGGIVLNEFQTKICQPKRTAAGVMDLLKQIETTNQSLEHQSRTAQNKSIMSSVLKQAMNMLGHNGTLILITDGEGFTPQDIEIIKRIASKQNIMMFLINDDLELDYRRAEGLVISDGERQLKLTSNEVNVVNYQNDMAQKIILLQRAIVASHLPFGQLNTVDTPHKQLAKLLMGR